MRTGFNLNCILRREQIEQSKKLLRTIISIRRFSVCAAYGSRTRKTGALQEDAGKLAEPEKPLKPLPHSSKGECGTRRIAPFTRFLNRLYTICPIFASVFSQILLFRHKSQKEGRKFGHFPYFCSMGCILFAKKEEFCKRPGSEGDLFRGGQTQKTQFPSEIRGFALDRRTDKLYNRIRQIRERDSRNKEKERI